MPRRIVVERWPRMMRVDCRPTGFSVVHCDIRHEGGFRTLNFLEAAQFWPSGKPITEEYARFFVPYTRHLVPAQATECALVVTRHPDKVDERGYRRNVTSKRRLYCYLPERRRTFDHAVRRMVAGGHGRTRL
jgi:hypothetical protein